MSRGKAENRFSCSIVVAIGLPSAKLSKAFPVDVDLRVALLLATPRTGPREPAFGASALAVPCGALTDVATHRAVNRSVLIDNLSPA